MLQLSARRLSASQFLPTSCWMSKAPYVSDVSWIPNEYNLISLSDMIIDDVQWYTMIYNIVDIRIGNETKGDKHIFRIDACNQRQCTWLGSRSRNGVISVMSTETKTLSCLKWKNLWRYKRRDVCNFEAPPPEAPELHFEEIICLRTLFFSRFCLFALCKSLKIHVFCLAAGRGSAWWFTPGISEDVMTWYDMVWPYDRLAL